MGRMKTNALGLAPADYKGKPSTLCPGCGHNSISNQIMDVAFDLGLEQHKIIKMSGIGCSSKTPAYFLGRSHAFNAIHGRMPSVTTGAVLANHDLRAIGVSGDGDTGNIGLGQFKHMIRRNVPMVYIIENNGVYGLTKGQFSATADLGQRTKYAGLNEYPALDLCVEAIAAECTFVARSFSGDAKQIQSLLKAALSHRGTAVIDVISPCVTFNDHEDSTKSYHWGREHREILNEIGFIRTRDDIAVDYEEGGIQDVQLHDGSWVRLKKLDESHDPTDRISALRILEQARQDQVILTGLIYIDQDRPTAVENARMTQTPLAFLPEEALRPSEAVLEQALASLFTGS
jgi:2-oxoglutarate ferredoxin oxidoreductase subunit beta